MSKAQAGLRIGLVFGILFFWLITNMWMDFAGKQGTIDYINNSWINTSPYMWLIIIVLTMFIYKAIYLKMKDE